MQYLKDVNTMVINLLDSKLLNYLIKPIEQIADAYCIFESTGEF